MQKEGTQRDRYTVVLEDIQGKINLILEAVEPIPQMQHKIDATFEEVGNMRVDVEVIKETMKTQTESIRTQDQRIRALE